MARYYGKIGYGENVETKPGVWELVIVERAYFGDVQSQNRRLEAGEKVLSDIRVGNSISVVADAYALNHFLAIQYIEWTGGLWVVDDVTVQAPRLILRLGGVYNGPKVATPSPP